MVRLIDHDECAVMSRNTTTAKSFERGELNTDLSARCCCAPHIAQHGWCDDQALRGIPCDGKGDKRLAHSDGITEKGTTELLHRGPDSRHGRDLVGPEHDGPKDIAAPLV